MKAKYLYILIMLLGFVGCSKDYPGDSYDFSNSTNPYVEFKSTKISVSAPSTFTFTVRLRTAISSGPTTVGYELSGALSGSGTVVIERNKIEGVSSTISVPVEVLNGAASSSATLKLVSAKNSSLNIDLGRNGTGNQAVVTIKAK